MQDKRRNKAFFENVDEHVVKTHFIRPDFIIGMIALQSAVMKLENRKVSVLISSKEDLEVESSLMKSKKGHVFSQKLILA